MPLRHCKTALFCLAISLSCCHPRPKQPPPDRSFYYWKSVYSLTGKEREYLQALRVSKLYVRFFDVTWDVQRGAATPTAPILFKDSSYLKYAVVPVVFITNEVLVRLDTAAVRPLAEHIAGLVLQLRDGNRLPPADELQLDCDWTAVTRDRYFSLLTDIRRWLDGNGQGSCRLSATIRLYQCKYRDLTGVPPVAKGLLMCYNMGDLKNSNAHNSIIETAELEKYTSKLSSYPLSLDVAFPIFNWKVLFHEGRYAGLMETLPTAALANDAVMRTGNRYTFRRDTTLNGHVFDPGDQLRDEQSDYHAVQSSANVIAGELKSPPGNVVLFHLDSANLANYTPDELENIFARFD
ncbi:MAG TPA: hypothetical protein VG101_08605 [Puia sp.]|nr:hypothetical protein [Puia sp.]